MPIAGYCQEYVTDTIPVMTLKAYEDSVVNYSQVLKQKKEQFFAAKAKKDVSRTGYLPKISAAGSGTIDLKRLNQWHNPRGIYHPYTYFAGGNVSQVIYGGGSVIAQYKADEISEDISQQQVLLNVNDIFLQADNAYWTAAANQELLHVSREYYNIILNQYHIIKLKFDNGAIAKNDLLMITTRLKEAELDIKKAEASYLLAFQNFNILMGITPDHRPEKIESILSELDFPLEGTYETADRKSVV